MTDLNPGFIPGARPQVVLQRALPHGVERVWRAVSTEDGLAAWFPSKVGIDLRVGGAVTFEFGPDGVVTDLDAPHLIAFTWGEDHLRFELATADSGTVLTLTHTFGDRAGAASFASGWTTCLAELALALEGGVPGSHGLDPVALHDRFVEEFGLDAAVVDGLTVRVERQLTAPVAASEIPADPDGTVWALGPGTGHGPRLTGTYEARDDADRTAAAASLPHRLAALATRLTTPAS
jgi:uncharacterized protein YndB with AHSA1/START domain